MNEKKNAARERAIQIKSRGAKNAYRSALPGWVPIRQINNRPTLCTAPNLRKMQ
jgi:hypothetical protein